MPIKMPGASTNENLSAGERHFRAGTPPTTSRFMTTMALLVGAAVVVVSWLTLLDVRATLSATAQGVGTVANVLLAASATIAIFIMYPAVQGLRTTQQARRALAAGDLIAILSAGAYGMVMASNYNQRGRAAEILVSGKQRWLTRKRETWNDLLRGESIPAPLKTKKS